MHVCPDCGLSFESAGFCPEDGRELANRGRDVLLGQVLGPYRIASVVGVGGMGVVYKAIHPTIGSRVAIKVLNLDKQQSSSSDDSAEQLERFFAEAKAVNVIRHENIVNILDFSTLEDGRPYLVMEYLDGQSLQSVFTLRGQLPLGGFGKLMVEVLSAIGAAHATNVIHRDLKPDNIFVSPQGHAKVLDFGVAKLDKSGLAVDNKTKTGALLGTPYYMAPEQAQGEKVDARADVYAIGVILYEGVTGKRLFDGKTLYELLIKHVQQEPVSPRSLRPDLPKLLERVILKALAKDPRDRFQSAAEMSEALIKAMGKLPSDSFSSISQIAAVSGQTIKQEDFQSSVGSGRYAARATLPSLPRKSRGALVAIATIVALLTAGTFLFVNLKKEDNVASVKQNVPASSSSLISESSKSEAPIAGESSTSSIASLASSKSRSMVRRSSSVRSRSSKSKAVIAKSSARSSVRSAVAPLATAPRKGLAARPTTWRKPNGGVGSQVAASNSSPSSLLQYSKYLSLSKKEARAFHKDARLSQIMLHGVMPDGNIHPKLTSHPIPVSFIYFSKERHGHLKKLPKGASAEIPCSVTVSVYRSGYWQRHENARECRKMSRAGYPRCSPKQVWDKAKAIGAPSDAVANLQFRWRDGARKWEFRIPSHFIEDFLDDC